MKRITLLTAVFISFLFLPFISARAQIEPVGEGIKISPVKFEKTVFPGEIISEIFKVTNESDNPREMRIFIKDFIAGDELGKPKLLDPGEGEGYFLSSWIRASAESYIFEPREEKVIDFKVEVPANAGPGGYFGAIIIGTVAKSAEVQSEDKGAAIATSHQAAALLLYRVAGDADERALVKDFKSIKPVYGAPFKVDFLTRIESLGNVHIKPAGMIEVFNMFGEKKAAIPFNDKGANILPNSVRRFENGWSGKFGFGKYRANLILSYGLSVQDGGSGKKTLDSVSYFWVIPWKVLVPSLIGLISLVILLIAIMRFYRNKAIKQVLEDLGAGNIAYSRPTTGIPSRPPIGLLTAFFSALTFLIGVIIYFIFFA